MTAPKSYTCHCGRVLVFARDVVCPCVPLEEIAARVGTIMAAENAAQAFHMNASVPHRCLGAIPHCPACGHSEPHAPRTDNLSSGRCPTCMCLYGWQPPAQPRA